MISSNKIHVLLTRFKHYPIGPNKHPPAQSLVKTSKPRTSAGCNTIERSKTPQNLDGVAVTSAVDANVHRHCPFSWAEVWSYCHPSHLDQSHVLFPTLGAVTRWNESPEIFITRRLSRLFISWGIASKTQLTIVRTAWRTRQKDWLVSKYIAIWQSAWPRSWIQTHSISFNGCRLWVPWRTLRWPVTKIIYAKTL